MAVNNGEPGSAERQSGFTRRGFISAGATTATLPLIAGRALAGTPAQRAEAPDGDGKMNVTLRVNGQDQRLGLDSRTSLLDALRDHIGVTGTKKGCDHGQCGACTVLMDGKRVLSCMTLAVMAQGQDITTIEGLARPDGELHPMQQAFIDNDAFQCGYCTPGQILSAIGCVNEGHAGSDAEIREYMSGNLCRCAAYPNIVAAVQQAKTEMKEA
ncbi:xanthine dehydrogenase YagT iron-sulfur-binding subunit [Faunimonas pinastri]|uniref:Xanthine dehydrogenase YagT iron-sulfur-binding subunit n=1 Tax=Faunimonas pinastri TaxID=1855383 RepID=A0A1H9A3Q9_9HYPH|nr:(2Fe-2S)-binding protein [Faunimonas pinastri]SEP71255.1 xanthine dehydrogenase YagT iron-sulfur-binding subunit [Faunimonas pinastri]